MQKPRKPFYEKARILAVCEPRYMNPRYNETLPESCKKEIEKIKKIEEVIFDLKVLKVKELLSAVMS